MVEQQKNMVEQQKSGVSGHLGWKPIMQGGIVPLYW